MTMAAATSLIGFVMKPLNEQYGWSRAEITSGFLIVSLCWLVLAPVAGAAIGRWGVRRVAVATLMATAAGFGAIGLSGPSLWSWFGAWLWFGIATAAGPTVWMTAVSRRFDKHRGTAISVAKCGSALAFAAWPPIVGPVITHFGWQAVYWLLALVTLVIVAPLNLIALRENPTETHAAVEEKPATRLTGFLLSEALRRRQFWQIAGGMFSLNCAVAPLMIHLFPMMMENGVASSTGTWIVTCFGPAMIFGTLISGYLMDRLPAYRVMAAASTLPAITYAVLGLSISDASAYALGAVALGIATGFVSTGLPYLVGRYFGLRDYQSIYALLVAVQSVIFGIAPVAAGYIADAHGGYAPLYMFLPAVLAVAILLLVTLGRPAPFKD
jgi:MFS family permease